MKNRSVKNGTYRPYIPVGRNTFFHDILLRFAKEYQKSDPPSTLGKIVFKLELQRLEDRQNEK